MNRILIYIYFAFYIAIYIYDVFGFSPHPDPQWIVNLEAKSHAAAIIFMACFIFKLEMRKIGYLGKIIFIAIVLFDIYSWYYSLFISETLSITVITLTTITIFLITFPSWYLIFLLLFKGVRLGSDRP